MSIDPKIQKYMERKCKQVILERHKVGGYIPIGDSFLKNFGLTITGHGLDVLTDYITVGWFQYFYAGKVQEYNKETINVPTSAWQHIKKDYFPAWLKERWPVKSKSISVVIQHLHICPHMELPKTSEAHVSFVSMPCYPKL